jgi:prepilin-type N-terminal cleavage/methylation domain-containing protein/prepilin-type processing-associated H-X9-DG protein
MTHVTLSCRPRTRRNVRGFTLVELLVVIGIIALLVSILLPSLNRARRSARTVQCASNLRTILQGMNMYVAENKGFFPGGCNTSGAFLMNGTYGDANCPNISQVWDWQAPIANYLGFKYETGGSTALRQQRVRQFLEWGVYRCPENTEITVGPFAPAGWPVLPMQSYATAMVFHMNNNKAGNAGDQLTTARSDWNPPPGYVQKITKVGDTSRKIYIADGGRYSDFDTPPDYDASFKGQNGGMFSDQGAFTKFSKAWDRQVAPGNGPTGIDGRLYGFRHGVTKSGAAADTMRGNFGFFDGHVENLGDLQAANPAFWVPKGTNVNITGELYPDAAALYGKGQTTMVISE